MLKIVKQEEEKNEEEEEEPKSDLEILRDRCKKPSKMSEMQKKYQNKKMPKGGANDFRW